jgi:pyruvate/2-oxoglutarate dehydrogenase complex dihydrolipoamide dehydrogenase (E3) component
MSSETKGGGIYNVVVIGAGTAGLVTAAGTAGLGGRVALIERNKMGGDCLNFGCIPSKALISSARLIERIRRAPDWGLNAMEPQFEFMEVFERMRQRRALIAPNDSQERFESLGVDVFRGEAKFISPSALQVGDTTLKAKNFVIATGSRATIPKIAGIDTIKYFTNETIFDELKQKPQSMIILGGGPIGCELAQTFCRLGVEITIAQRANQLLPKEDEEVAHFLEHRLASEGVRIIKKTEAHSVATSDRGKVALDLVDRRSGRVTEMTFFADAILVAVGRTPNFRNLDLQAAGVEFDEKGIRVNEYLQTSQPHIYAVGDVIGPYLFTHMADAQARLVVRNILMPLQLLRQKIDYSVVPWCTYVDPEVATVGLTETAAKRQNIEYDVFILKMDEVDRAVVESEDEGFAKVLLAKGTDKILGATLVCDHAGDLLHELVLAKRHGIGLGAIAATVHAYPTFAELARKLGDKYNKTRLTPTAKKIFRWLYRRGLPRK